jgi:hypothetical protein
VCASRYTPTQFGPAILPFGFGLSFTNFTYEPQVATGESSMAPVRAMLAEMAASGRSFPDSNKLKAAPPPVSHTIKVTNTGDVDADDVVLGFLKPPGAGKQGVPLQMLYDFARVHISAGSSELVTLRTTARDFTQVNPHGVRYALAGEYTFEFGVKETLPHGGGFTASTLVMKTDDAVAGLDGPFHVAYSSRLPNKVDTDPRVSWQRGSQVRLTVYNNFTYTAVVAESSIALNNGLVGLRCGGQYRSTHDGGLLRAGPQKQHSSTHPRLGATDEVSQQFVNAAHSGSCKVTATIRYLHDFDAFTFKLSFPNGADGTLAYPTPRSRATNASGLPLPGEWAGDAGNGYGPAGNDGSLEPALPLASHFPSFQVPADLNFMATNGDLIAGNFATKKMGAFAGGLGGGFITIFNQSSSAADPNTQQLPAITLSPLTHHKAVYVSQAVVPGRGEGPMQSTDTPIATGDRVSVGVSGYIDSIPVAYEQEAVLSSRGGIVAAYVNWGQVMQANGGSVKYSLDDDEYSRVLHYMMDNGGYYCYCNGFKPCQAAAKVPMHVTIDLLQKYHKSLGLRVGIYHLDPFWHTHRTSGQCDGPWASNWSHSEYHWPKGLGEHGSNPGTHWQMLYMLLAGSEMHAARWKNQSATGNEYADNGYVMEDQDLPDGQLTYWTGCCARTAQAVAKESHRFWDDVLGYGVRTNNMHAMVVDTLTTWFLGYTSRINNTDAHELWMDGYLGPSHGHSDQGGGATKHRIPIRTDQSLPSDQMLSVARNWSALVSARCSYDFQEVRSATTQFASTGLFLAALGIRPVVDALRTTSIQQEATCGPPHGNGKTDIEHDLLMATLTTGPVGIGDMIGGTNLTLLNRALRADGVILKPGFAAHRLDNFYLNASDNACANAEVWSAPTLPARANSSARHDRRSNSMARLFPLSGQPSSGGGLWWYSLLLWDLSKSNCTLIPPQLSPPALSRLGYVVSRFGAPCQNGAPAASCLQSFEVSKEGALVVATETSGTGRSTDVRLHQVAPVLPGGWVLLGEQAKYVAVSPQRFMAANVSTSAMAVERGSDELYEDELLLPGSGGQEILAFTVLGEAGESVDVAVIAPTESTVAINTQSADRPRRGEHGTVAEDVVAEGLVTVLQVVVGEGGRSEVACGIGSVGCRVT